ncbi:MAG: zinc-dependent peptidase [Flavobacterium sp.]|uniref:zinc-dependent peptidase n=1 Tax=Flavobacterium sp. TaxID=239 RepID=UPI002B46AACB|nr:zinc-dependent peptidase [Flavobacterium sp.]WRH74361.1 MAG: zinc-dependent peptidase [Flavobacterium sp.]
MISNLIALLPEDKYELVFGDYIGMLILITPLLSLFLFFSFYVIEIIYLRNYKKPLVVFANVNFYQLQESQKQILTQNFQFYKQLKPKYKRYFEHRIANFINTYEFVGRDISVTEEMKVTIAGTAIMLTFGMRDYLNPLFKRIIIFPDIYYSDQTENYHKGEFNPRLESIVFSWKHFKEGIEITNDNLNLGLHEFTHAFHIHSLKNDKATAVLFNESLQNLFKVVSNPQLKEQLITSGFLRDYAYENQFEFVAVLLEYFFESPQEFKSKFPSIFLKVKHMINYNEKYFIASEI